MKPQDLIRWRTRKMRWTQAQAALWWGVSRRTWQRYEDGSTTELPRPLVIRIENPSHDVTYLVDKNGAPR